MIHSIDLPAVSEEGAVQLMIHHLALAAAYFECTGEYENVIVVIDEKIPDIHRAAFTAFLKTINKSYEDISR